VQCQRICSRSDSSLTAPILSSHNLSHVPLQNIPGLDAPSWSRISGHDEQQEEEEELKAEQIWIKQQTQQGDKAVQVRREERMKGRGRDALRMTRRDVC